MNTETSELKERAIRYFDEHSTEYAVEHYERPINGAKWHRHQILLEDIKSLKLPQDSQVLDLGCGPGFLARDLAGIGIGGVGMDSSQSMINYCTREAQREGIADSQWRFVVGDAEKLPFKEETFDVVVASGLIEYLPTDESILREIQRVLKPGGYALLSVTNRFGYTNCLLPVSLRVRRIPGVIRPASAVRRALVGQPIDAQKFEFDPRRHNCAEFRRKMQAVGLQPTWDHYLHYSLFPAPFCTMLSRITGKLDDRLTFLNKTPLRRLGACYIGAGRKQ
jgi:ubiquinone/menaquinone biosynthesis C-methylase UbiE